MILILQLLIIFTEIIGRVDFIKIIKILHLFTIENYKVKLITFQLVY